MGCEMMLKRDSQAGRATAKRSKLKGKQWFRVGNRNRHFRCGKIFILPEFFALLDQLNSALKKKMLFM